MKTKTRVIQNEEHLEAETHRLYTAKLNWQFVTGIALMVIATLALVMAVLVAMDGRLACFWHGANCALAIIYARRISIRYEETKKEMAEALKTYVKN